MRSPVISRLLIAAALTGGTTASALALAGVAGAVDAHASQPGNALFVESDSPSGNTITSYVRASDGTVQVVATTPTGGLGGVAAGAGSDPLASQGGLLLADHGTRLVATNAGSNTLSVFRINDAKLRLIQQISSLGAFPTSLTASNNFVAVLNAGGAGSVAEYQWSNGQLVALAGQVRSLGLANAAVPFFLTAPGQVGYSPDGTHLIVSDKLSAQAFQVFSVASDGSLGTAPVNSAALNAVPFSFVFDASGRLVATEAATSSVSVYNLNADGTLSALSTVSDGAHALCWISAARGYYYGSNTGSASVSSFHVDANGTVTLVNATAGVAHAGTTDSVASPDGNFLYVESGGAGTIDVFAVGANGALTPVQTLFGLSLASEGLAIS